MTQSIIEHVRAERAALVQAADAVIATAEAEQRSLTTEEFATVQAAADSPELRAIDERLATLTDLARRNAAAATEIPTSRGGARVGTEARTYRPDNGTSFFADLYASSFPGQMPGRAAEAAERLARHSRETQVDRRDIAVAALAGAVPPQYLVDQFAGVARSGRPFLNSLNALPLPPEGISFFIPRGTTGSAGAMTTEGAGFNEQDMANTNDNPIVTLVTAQEDISRTLFMRGGSVVDQIIFPDLMAASEVALNASALNGNGTLPNHRGILQVSGISAVTYTDASPTVPELWPKFSDAIQRVNSLRYMPATAVYMHPRRWGWVTSAVDTTGRPLFEFSTRPPAPNSVIGLGVAAEYGQVVGTLQGLPVITDAGIPTNLGGGTEDIIIVARTADIRYWEDDMLQFTFEQTLSTAPGQVRLAVGRFSLFHAGRYPTAISTIGGTGLVTPTF